MAQSRQTRRHIQFQACPILDLPPELRIMVHRLVLADYQDDKASIQGALLSCKQMKAELEDEITKDLVRGIIPVLKDVAKAWNKEYFPFRASIPVHIEGVKRPEVQISLAIPISAFGRYVYTTHLKGIEILKRLMMLNIARLKISRFDDGQLPCLDLQPYRRWKQPEDMRLLLEDFSSSNRDESTETIKTHVRRVCFDFGTAGTKKERFAAYVDALELERAHYFVPCTLEFENEYGSRVRRPYPPLKLSRENIPVRAIWIQCSYEEMDRHKTQELLRL